MFSILLALTEYSSLDQSQFLSMLRMHDMIDRPRRFETKVRTVTDCILASVFTRATLF